MSLKALSDYTVYSRYAHYLPDKKRRETWSEIVDRVFSMHERKFKNALETNSEFKKEFDFAKEMVKKKRVLGSQRALQFGGKWIERHNLKMFNCSTSHVDRETAFQEIMYALLCGVGMGFSVQRHHIEKLPKISKRDKGVENFIVPDSIEGWSDAIGIVVNSYFKNSSAFPQYCGKKIEFDYSLIRERGKLIAGQFKAPGPEGLKSAIEKIEKLIDSRLVNNQSELRPIDVYDIIMHSSDAVLSGGIRRSAAICLFSPDDDEMIKSKTGDWYIKNPQRARSNNSAALLKNDTTKEQFNNLLESTRAFGEPGFIFLDDRDIVFNPCCEIGMIPKLNGESGIQVCNLTEINGGYCDDAEKFYECCRAASIIGTLQAAYTDFVYLSSISKKICDNEALLGCSITGIMDNPDILLNEDIQKEGARIVLETNEKIASMIGINKAARATAVKPAGSTSCVLKTASGVHPHHSRRYIRNVQANKTEFPVQLYEKVNPVAVKESVWSANKTDNVISFICEVPKGAIVKNNINAVDFLKQIKLTQNNWVEFGTRVECCVHPKLRHNVSCTVTVKDNEWEEVGDFIYNNRHSFAGISLLSSSGDLDYVQAPFTTVLTPNEMVQEYGDASILSSGLVVDGLKAFDNNLWDACSCVLGYGEMLREHMDEPQFPVKNGYTDKQFAKRLVEYYDMNEEYERWFLKRDWVRRVHQFAERYFSDVEESLRLRKATYCLKHAWIWHRWLELKRNHVSIDWSEVVEENQEFVDVDTTGAVACSGGQCSLVL